jgi:hypothetical protein
LQRTYFLSRALKLPERLSYGDFGYSCTQDLEPIGAALPDPGLSAFLRQSNG